MWVRTRRDIFNLDDVLRFHCYDWADNHENIVLTMRDTDNQISVDREEGERILAFFHQRKGQIRLLNEVIDDTFLQNNNPLRDPSEPEPEEEDDQPEVGVDTQPATGLDAFRVVADQQNPMPMQEIDMTQVRAIGEPLATGTDIDAVLDPPEQFQRGIATPRRDRIVDREDFGLTLNARE
jgi:hypothetical protein